MTLMHEVLASVIRRLVASGELSLVSDDLEEALVNEIHERIGSAPAFDQLGPFIARVLMESDIVDELYADDSTIVALFNDAR